jgi:hypothetical protein
MENDKWKNTLYNGLNIFCNLLLLNDFFIFTPKYKKHFILIDIFPK